MRAYQALSSSSGASRVVQPGSELTERLDLLLAEKLVSVLRSRRHHFLARRDRATHAVDLFLAHSIASQGHADSLAGRIVELEAEPEFSPAMLSRIPAGFFAPDLRLREMAEEDLEATRATGGMLKSLVQFVGADDPATRRLLLAILEADKAHSKELAALIASLGRAA